MGYPLIQQPAPLQQLAQTIAAIREAREARIAMAEERRMAAARDRRAQRYLELEEARTALAGQRAAAEERHNAAILASNQMEAERAAKLAVLTARRQMAQMVQQGLPENYTITAPAALAEADRLMAAGAGGLKGALVSGVPGVDETIRSIQSRVGPGSFGMQGSAVRAPTPVTEGGVTFTPPTLNLNQPAGGGTGASGRGGLGHIAQRVALGAGLMRRIVTRANELEGADPTAAAVPISADVGAAVAERVLGTHAGGRVADRIRNLGATDVQMMYRGLREQFKHSMAVFFPRVSIALMENLSDSYFPVPGESPSARAEKMAARNDVMRMVELVEGGQASVDDLARTIGGRGGAVGQAFLEAYTREGGEMTPAYAAPDSRTSMPTQTPRQRSINPRFLR